MAEDRIQVKGMKFFGHHGITNEEQFIGQRIEVDVEIEFDLEPAGKSDDPNLTVDYTSVFQVTKEIVEGKSVKLMETLAQTICDQLILKLQVESAWVKVIKPNPPIENSVIESVAIEVQRDK
ncbi:MAG: dihydroneopterin aldolase [Dehalococcoidia bacterium]|nr:dihydroneopterin aldolase [Dehalococcoidia bacterium]MQG16460.1 dihydroneopterin aldolase [SAR202 cluster bacterium]|tara:strand:- start:23394 stop:23759 length:366 start_codon:yes stop_codon:yes gene_type:complete